MALEENPTLFGHDPEAGLVAVEPSGPDSVDLLTRAEDGRLLRRSAPLRPLAWCAGSVQADDVEWRTLKGGLALGVLAECTDWPAFQNLRTRLKAEGMPHHAPTDPVHQYLLASGKTLFKGLPYEDLRRLQIWLPEAAPITHIELADNHGFHTVLEGGDERALLEELTRVVSERDPDVIEGHDLFRSLLTRIAGRARRVRLKLPWGRNGSVLSSRSSRLQIAEKTISYPKFTAEGRHFVDTYLLAQLWDVGARALEGFTLEEVAAHFHLEGSAPAQTAALAELLGASHFIQARIFPFSYQDVFLRGNATRIDTLFLREYLRRGHSIPLPPEAVAYEGGYTDVFFTGVAKDVWHCDVASLYPSVMLRFGHFPPADELGIFRGLLGDLRRFRLEAKEALRAAATPTERHHLGALQSAFKILINSFYGYLGFAQGHFADFDVAAEVTRTGRELLRTMVEWLQAQGAGIIEIDTDGIYFTPPPGATEATLQAGLAAVLPEGIEVDFDARYPAMFSYKAKNYALLTQEGEVLITGGAFRSRGLEKYLRRFLAEGLRALLEGEPGRIPTVQATFEAAIRNREWPIEELMKSDTLQDSVAQYQRKIEGSARGRAAAYELALQSGRDLQPGDSVRYYITGEKRTVTAWQAARPVETWDAQARDENVEYYVAKLKDAAKRFAEFLPEK